MMLLALESEVDELDLLFFVSRKRLIDGDELRQFETQLHRRWGVRANVILCPLPDRKVPGTRLRRVIERVFNAATKHAPTFGEECRNAVERCLERNPELIFVFSLSSMGSVLTVREKLPPIIFDLNDIEHVKAFRYVAPRFSSKRLFALLTVPSLIKLERRAINFVEKGLVCSEHDRRYLSQWLRVSNVEVVPNAVHLPEARDREAPTLTIGYLGYFPYRPNKKAAEELIRCILPIVRNRLPHAKLLIAGAHPECIPSFERAQIDCNEYVQVEFTGFLPDLSHFYDRVQLVCCPIRAGSGTRLKIIEAAAHGLPVVATPLAAEGLNFENGTEIILEEHPVRIAESCISLLLDPGRCRAIGSAARAKVAALYEQSTVISSIQQLIRRVANDSQISQDHFSWGRAAR
jgi:glycosyltransferase involved in cell wall biosynthesis